ncbi:MAG TPA: TPM domain-containing protein [Clostridia bacterium]|nr:TPM domain-containing protein [Clostridia bacterium]
MKNRTKTLGFMLIIILLIGLFSPSAYGLEIPKAPTEDIYVQDYASILSKEVKDDMLKMSSVLKETTTAELVVVTVPSMDGRPVEEYALNLFRQWGIGSKDQRNGVLLLVADEDREARIEVGYGLEGAINDAKAGAILDEMIAYFQIDDYDKGIATAYSLLLNEILVEYNVDADVIFEGAKAITPVTLQNPVLITDIFKIVGPLLLIIIGIMLVLSRIMGRGPFWLIALLLRNLSTGRYAGPTHRGPMDGGFGGGFWTGHSSGPFGGGSHRSGPTIGRGKFGGGSSGGGGASRKW